MYTCKKYPSEGQFLKKKKNPVQYMTLGHFLDHFSGVFH